MIGLIDVGGGMRGIYSAAVLDWCIDNNIQFDWTFGVSAGSNNITSFVAGQRGRSYRFYVEYPRRKEYMGLWQKIKTGNFLNLDYVYGVLSASDGEDPLDYDTMMASPMNMCVVASDALTGDPVYFYKETYKRDDYGFISASCCVPWVNQPTNYRGHLYYDGGFSDPIPIEKAFELGCDKVIVLLTRPRDFYRNPKRDRKLARPIRRKYPQTAEKLARRAELYNEELDLVKHYEKEGRAMIIAPDTIEGMDTLTRNREKQNHLYQKGLADAPAMLDFMR